MITTILKEHLFFIGHGSEGAICNTDIQCYERVLWCKFWLQANTVASSRTLDKYLRELHKISPI